MATEQQLKEQIGSSFGAGIDPTGLTPDQIAASERVARTFGSAGNSSGAPAFETAEQMAARVSRQGKPGYDVFGNPVAGGSSAFTPRTITNPNEDAATSFLNTFTAPQTAEQIAEEKRKAAQAEIDNLNKLYDNYVSEQRIVNEGRSRGTNAVSVLTGLSGSTEANTAREQTDKVNQREIDAINAERGAKIASILSGIQSEAVAEARAQREEARASAESILAMRTERQTKAVSSLTALSNSGVTAEGLKQTDPETYDYLVRQIGSELEVQSLFTLNRPQESIIDKRVENGKYIIAYQNPLSGQTRIETVDLGIPQGYNKTIDAGNRILFVPDNWDGNTENLISIAKGLTPSQQQQNAVQPGENPQLYSGLSSATATAVRAQVNAFKAEPVIQNFATIQSGYNFTKQISDDTKNPADDQALIYALAKALDPGSVVREGEYATAQKYSQAWITAFGSGVKNALLGTGFLSNQARTNIKKTIETRYNAAKTEYDSLRNNYSSGISTLTGRSDGEIFLRDYTTTGNDISSVSAGATGYLPDGTEVTMNQDGTITDSDGNYYDQDGNRM